MSSQSQQLSSQSQQLSSHTAAIGDLKTQLSAANRKVARLEAELKDAKTDLATTKRELAQAKRERDAVQAEYERFQREVREQDHRHERGMRAARRESAELRERLEDEGQASRSARAEVSALTVRIAEEEARRMQAEADRQEAERARQANEAGRVSAEEIRRLRDLVREDIEVQASSSSYCYLNSAQFDLIGSMVRAFCGQEYSRRRYVWERAITQNEEERARLDLLIKSTEKKQCQSIMRKIEEWAIFLPISVAGLYTIKGMTDGIDLLTADYTFMGRFRGALRRAADSVSVAAHVAAGLVCVVPVITSIPSIILREVTGPWRRSFTIKSPESLEGGEQQIRA